MDLLDQERFILNPKPTCSFGCVEQCSFSNLFLRRPCRHLLILRRPSHLGLLVRHLLILRRPSHLGLLLFTRVMRKRYACPCDSSGEKEMFTSLTQPKMPGTYGDYVNQNFIQSDCLGISIQELAGEKYPIHIVIVFSPSGCATS